MNKTGIVFGKQNIKSSNEHIPKIGLGINIAILACVIIGIIAMFAGLHPSQYPIYSDASKAGTFPGVFPGNKARYLGYFSLVINMIMAIVSIMNIVCFAKIRKGKMTMMPKCMHVINMSVASCLFVNFIFCLIYLMPVVAGTGKYYFAFVFTGSNLLFNGFVPVLALMSYVFCFKGQKLNIKESLFGSLPLLLYCLVYGILALCHIQDGKIAEEYDLYLFGIKYFWLIFIAFIAIMACSIGINILVCKLNSIARINRFKFVFTVDIFVAIAVPFFTALMFYHNMAQDCYEEGLTPIQTFGMRFLFFTHWSNWLMGVACIIQAVYINKIFKGKAKVVPTWVQVVKLSTAAMIFITLIMQWIIAASKMIANPGQHGIDLAYKQPFARHLLFEHFIIPLVAVVSWLVLEHSEIKFKHIFYAAIPLAFYGFIYSIILYIGTGCGWYHYPKGDTHVTAWDVYDFVNMLGNAGKYLYWSLALVGYAVMFPVNWLFWLINRKIRFDYPKAPSVKEEFKAWKQQRIKAHK